MTAATAARVGMDFEDFQKAAASQIPVRRVGQPDDVAHAVVVPRQRGRRVRLRPGDLRGGRPAVLTPAGTGGAAGTTALRERRSAARGSTADDLRGQVSEFLASTTRPPPTGSSFLRARFDAGLAWVHYPAGPRRPGPAAALQPVVDAEFAAAGAPDNNPERNGIGLGMAAPTILAFGTRRAEAALAPAAVDRRGDLVPAVQRAGRRLRPGRPRDPRGPRDGDDWIVNGQKVWTSSAHQARVGAAGRPHRPGRAQAPRPDLLRGRHDTRPGVEVRPLRQITGEAEFNEVFLTDVRDPGRATGSARSARAGRWPSPR